MVFVMISCKIVDVPGDVFTITIDVDEKTWVEDLKIKITNQKLLVCDLDCLQHFLTVKHGAWLQVGTDDVDTLMKGGRTAIIEVWLDEDNEIDGACGLKKVLNGAPPLEINQIHVLVVVPEEAEPQALQPAGSLKEMIKEVVNNVFDQRDKPKRKRDEKTYLLSDLNDTTKHQILRKMGRIEDVPHIKEPEDRTIPDYQWIEMVAEDEESQRAAYLSYLRQHLKTLIDRGDFWLDDSAADKVVLDVKDPRLPFKLRGTASVLLVNRSTKSPLMKLSGVSVVIEVKKSVDSSRVPQVLGQLLSGSIKAPVTSPTS